MTCATFGMRENILLVRAAHESVTAPFSLTPSINMKHLTSCTRRVFRLFAASLLIATVALPARAQLLFEFVPGPSMVTFAGSDPGTAALISAAMTAAGAKWSGSLSDPITVKITVDLDAGLPSSVFAAAVGVKLPTSFLSVKGALSGDVLSATDVSAVSSLQSAPKIEALTQDTSTVVVPSPEIRLGGSTPGIWNSTLAVTRPNLKALGLLSGTAGAAGADGLLKINPAKIAALVFDYTRGDGITGGKFDFTGIAIHELGHLMGFFSGVDEVDYAGDGAPGNPATLSGTAIFSVLDLYRYSAHSLIAPTPPSTGKVNDWRFGPAPADFLPKPYFSVDAGATDIADFATGAYHGDGDQASHFSSGVPAIMDPGFGPGIEVNPTGIDVTAMDAIGWNLVPEPGTALLLLGALAFAAARRRRD